MRRFSAFRTENCRKSRERAAFARGLVSKSVTFSWFVRRENSWRVLLYYTSVVWFDEDVSMFVKMNIRDVLGIKMSSVGRDRKAA